MEIGAWGDSITYGAGDATGLGWVGLLRNHFYDKDYGVYNRGICGDTTQDILKRFDTEVSSIEPNLIILAIGINDSKIPEGQTENKVPFTQFQKNIKELIDKAKSKAKKVIVIGLTEVNEQTISSSPAFRNETISKYDSYLKEIAGVEDISYIDMRGVLDIQSDLEDGTHPNAKGYKKMFDKIFSQGFDS
ncbi:MAG: GDSL-type esterase/lipase family protein [Parcubacteria group bacterium]